MSLLTFIIVLFLLFLLAVYASYRLGAKGDLLEGRGAVRLILAAILFKQLVERFSGDLSLLQDLASYGVGVAIAGGAYWLGARKRRRAEILDPSEVESVFGGDEAARQAEPETPRTRPAKDGDVDGWIYAPIEGSKR